MTTFSPGQTLGRGFLDIFLTDPLGTPMNAAVITYAIYYVDPGPPETEVLIGSATRQPVNPQIGEYYAALMVPPSATDGTYRIRWTIQQYVNSTPQEVVQEWDVTMPDSIIQATNYSQCESQMIRSLRILLRDQCVGGEETVELDVDGERMVVRMDDLWETLNPILP